MTISITTGNGYAGSIYTSTVAGQWRADGVDIPGETGTTYTMSFANEGKAITCNGSNAIELWVPTDLPTDPLAIMDIRQGITAPANAVEAWENQMGGTGAIQATAAAKPTYGAAVFNGNPGISFDGTSDFMVGPAINVSPAHRTYVGLAQFLSGSTQRNLLNTSTTGGYALRRNAASSGRLEVVSRGTAIRATSTSSPNIPSSVPHIISSRFTPSGPYAFRVDGVSHGTGTASGGFSANPGITTAQIGENSANNYPGGVIATFVVVDSYLSDNDNQALEGWVAWSSGNQNLLPVGHAYASSPPMIATVEVITGAASINDPADTMLAAGSVILVGAASITDPADTMSSAAYLDILGAASINDPADTMSSTGRLDLVASAIINDPADLLVSAALLNIVGAGTIIDPVEVLTATGYEPAADRWLYSHRGVATTKSIEAKPETRTRVAKAKSVSVIARTS